MRQFNNSTIASFFCFVFGASKLEFVCHLELEIWNFPNSSPRHNTKKITHNQYFFTLNLISLLFLDILRNYVIQIGTMKT